MSDRASFSAFILMICWIAFNDDSSSFEINWTLPLQALFWAVMVYVKMLLCICGLTIFCAVLVTIYYYKDTVKEKVVEGISRCFPRKNKTTFADVVFTVMMHKRLGK